MHIICVCICECVNVRICPQLLETFHLDLFLRISHFKIISQNEFNLSIHLCCLMPMSFQFLHICPFSNSIHAIRSVFQRYLHKLPIYWPFCFLSHCFFILLLSVCIFFSHSFTKYFRFWLNFREKWPTVFLYRFFFLSV